MENKELVSEPEQTKIVSEIASTQPKQQHFSTLAKILISFLFLATVALSATVLVLLKKPGVANAPDETFIPQKAPEVTTVPTVASTLDTSAWSTYTNTSAGFSFKYPKTVLLDKETKGATEIVMTVSVQKLSDIPEDLPLSMGRADALLEKERLTKGEGEGVLKIGSLNAQLSTTLSQFEVCSTIFVRKLVFYPGEYQVILRFSGPKEKMLAAMPSFFRVDSANCGTELVWNQEKIGNFETTLANKQGTGIAQEWYDIFTGVIDTITLVTPTISTAPVSGSIYKNTKYGFELNYSTPYKVLTDSDNLSGYPKGIALLYTGGQAYDIVIEVWDTEAAYKASYPTRLADVTVLKSGNKFITFFDNTNSSQNKQIIASAKLSAN